MFQTADIIIIISLIINLVLIYFFLNNQFQKNREETNSITKENREELSNTLDKFEERLGKNIKSVQETIEKQLDEMRKTVDEKLQTALDKRLKTSLSQVKASIDSVMEGIGQVRSIANDIGDLKNVLSNVKTKGVFGEYQLEKILAQLLTADQYSRNVATKEGSANHVEFAIKLPGDDSQNQVWLPVDSKFPSKHYEELNNLYEEGDKDAIDAGRKRLWRQIETFAKDISEKYIDPPNTTNFGIMFFPVEGIYAEVLRKAGFIQHLQNKYQITITGPTTMSAFLSSLQMGFSTHKLQKESASIHKFLKEIQEEFGTFESYIDEVLKSFNQASNKLEKLRTTRINVMSRKLNKIDSVELIEEDEILELSETPDTDE